MLRRVEHRAHVARLDDRAILHHQHLVRHRPNDVDVVRDQQIAEATLALQPLQKVQHLLLYRHIQRAGRLVENQQLRRNDQCARNRYALALATREFMRVATQQVGKLQLL